MLKNYKSATLWAVIFWALIFVAWSIIMFIPALEGNLFGQYIVYFIILIFLTWLCVSSYFKKASPSAKAGIFLAIYFLIIGTILDMIVTIPLFVKDWAGFYGSWQLYVGFAEAIIIAALVGHFLSKKKSKPTPVTDQVAEQ
jgi:hypothetical protein